MARLANVGPASPQHIREHSRQRSRGHREVNGNRQDVEGKEEWEKQTLGARKTDTIRRIKEDLGFDLADVFSDWPASLEARDLALNTLVVLEELLRIFSRYQGLDGRQIRLKLAEAVPNGKKPTSGPLKELLKIAQAAPGSGQHSASPPSGSDRQGTGSGSDLNSQSDLESSSKISEDCSEKEETNSKSESDEEAKDIKKEVSIELGRNILVKRSGSSRFTYSSDNLGSDEDHLSLEDSSGLRPSENQPEDGNSFLPDDQHHLLPDEQTNPPRDECSSLPPNDPNGSPSPIRSELQLGQNTRTTPELEFSATGRTSAVPSSKPGDQNGYLSETRSELYMDDHQSPTFAPGLGLGLPGTTTPESIQSPVFDVTAQCREGAAGHKDAASEEYDNQTEHSLRRASRSPGEDQTRAILQAALADAKSKHYDAIKEHQNWQTSCITICEVVDRAERKLAASCGTRIGTQELQDCTSEVLRQKARLASARQEKRAKQHQQLMHVTKLQERRLEAMLKARERLGRTEGTIRRIEALLKDMQGHDASSLADESCDDDGEVDSLMAALNDESS